ncbi:MAG: hypothetical protein ACP5I3_11755 [Thermoproteus sp.]
MRILQVPVRCPSCGASTTVAPGVESICPHCGARIYVPPHPVVPKTPYADCEAKIPEAEEALRRAKSMWPLPPDVVAQLEYYKAVGALECP